MAQPVEVKFESTILFQKKKPKWAYFKAGHYIIVRRNKLTRMKSEVLGKAKKRRPPDPLDASRPLPSR